MLFYRVTKYDPKNRSSRGIYTVNEWTSYCDIGKIFDGKKLTFEEYREIEDRYIEAIFYSKSFA